MSRRQVVLLVFVLFLATLAAWLAWDHYGPPRTYEEARDVTDRLVLEGRHGDCVRVWTRFTHRHPNEARAHASRALALTYRERWDAADEAVERALELDPDLPHAYLWRADVHEHRHDYGRRESDLHHAVQLLDEAIPREPQDSELRLRAVARQMLQEYDVALDDLDRALEAAPGDDRVLFSRARCHTYRRDFDAAIRDCDRIIAAYPRAAGALELKAYALRERGDADAALEAYDRALEINPQYVMTRISRAWHRVWEGKVGLAIDDVTAAVKANPHSARARFARAYVRGEYMRPDNYPRWAADNWVLAWVHYMVQYRALTDDLRRALELDAHLSVGHVLWAELQLRRGATGVAREHARRAVEMLTGEIEHDDRRAALLLWRASACVVLDDYDRARADTRAALDAATDEPTRESARAWLEWLDRADPTGGSAAPSPAQ